MKLAVSLIGLALASTALVAAAPTVAEPSSAKAPASVPAPSAEALELARKFVAITNAVSDPLEGLNAGAWPAASEQVADKAARADAEQRLKQLVARLEPKVRAKMPAIKEAYASAYSREFSADELRQLIAFAETPAGKHFISQSGVIEVEDSIIDAEAELWEEMTPILEEMRKEVCAERAAQRIAAGDIKAKCPLSREAETASG
jgi:hypothetical protein